MSKLRNLPAGGDEFLPTKDSLPAERESASELPLDVLGFESLIARNDVEGDFFPFIQRLETGSRDGRVVYKNVLAGILGDETETLFVVEPLYFATSHTYLS